MMFGPSRSAHGRSLWIKLWWSCLRAARNLLVAGMALSPYVPPPPPPPPRHAEQREAGGQQHRPKAWK
jgi:hypothetical protein